MNEVLQTDAVEEKLPMLVLEPSVLADIGSRLTFLVRIHICCPQPLSDSELNLCMFISTCPEVG